MTSQSNTPSDITYSSISIIDDDSNKQLLNTKLLLIITLIFITIVGIIIMTFDDNETSYLYKIYMYGSTFDWLLLTMIGMTMTVLVFIFQKSEGCLITTLAFYIYSCFIFLAISKTVFLFLSIYYLIIAMFDLGNNICLCIFCILNLFAILTFARIYTFTDNDSFKFNEYSYNEEIHYLSYLLINNTRDIRPNEYWKVYPLM
jgi:hypothetical protein